MQPLPISSLPLLPFFIHLFIRICPILSPVNSFICPFPGSQVFSPLYVIKYTHTSSCFLLGLTRLPVQPSQQLS